MAKRLPCDAGSQEDPSTAASGMDKDDGFGRRDQSPRIARSVAKTKFALDSTDPKARNLVVVSSSLQGNFYCGSTHSTQRSDGNDGDGRIFAFLFVVVGNLNEIGCAPTRQMRRRANERVPVLCLPGRREIGQVLRG